MNGPVMIDLAGLTLTGEDRELLAHPNTGGVILFTRNFESKRQLKELTDQIHHIKSRRLVIAVDQEGGRVQRFREPFTVLPPMRQFGRLYDCDQFSACQRVEDCGWVLGCELAEVGIDMTFAPVLDLDYGCSEVIGDRAFHKDPLAVAALASSLISGLHSAGVMTCGKHFPGHGAVTADSHHELPEDTRSRTEIEQDLLAFRKVIARGLPSIMTAHLVSRCESSEPVSFSSRWLREILRGELNYKGVIFSDDLSMRGADCVGGIVAKVERALSAGCEFLPICNDREAVLELYGNEISVTEARSFDSLLGAEAPPNNHSKTKRYESFVTYLMKQSSAEGKPA